MRQTVSGPFKLTEEEVNRSSTLDPVDIGQWCILLNDTYQFVSSEEEGEKWVSMLQSLG